jgi:hypothetical protein
VLPTQSQLAKGPVAVGTLMRADGGIKIAENGGEAAAKPADDAIAADEEMARRLQAQMDAQAYASSGGNRCVVPEATAFGLLLRAFHVRNPSCFHLLAG